MATEKKKKEEVLEVEFIFTPEQLKNNPDIASHYDEKSQKINYSLGDNTPKDFREELLGFMENSNAKEIISFNPIMEALVTLNDFKSLEYKIGCKESIQEYKDAKKFIGSFNTGLTAAKKTLKDPHIEYNKKVDKLYNFFKDESENTKSALDNGFELYLLEEEEKKKVIEQKKKAIELARIAELEKSNEENSKKIAAQHFQTRILEIESKINSIFFEVNTTAPSSNKEGLNLLSNKISQYNFEDLFLEKDNFNEEQKNNFRIKFDSSIKNSGITINTFIKALDLEQDNLKLNNEKTVLQSNNETLQAKLPSSLDSGPEDMPFEPAVINLNTPNVLNNDLEKLELMVNELIALKACVEDKTNVLKSIGFEDRELTKIQFKVTENSLPQLNEWCFKLVNWSTQKLNVYKEFLTTNK
jgi:hypothetical protein